MAFNNYRKESSERSDSENWTKQRLSTIEEITLDSIEGCNQNQDNRVTHLLERARVDVSDNQRPQNNEVLQSIVYDVS